MEKAVSVIMPVYNAEKYVEEAVRSILNQSFADFELLIIDDKGQDSSMDVVKSIKDPRIRIIANDMNRGISYATNVGMKNATGKYIALMDDDDIAMPDRLELEYDYLERHPEVDVVGGGDITVDEGGNIISFRREVICNPKRIKAEFLFRDKIHNATAMFRRDFVEKNGLFYKDGFWGMQDFKFWTECAACGTIANIDKIVSHWRKHNTNTSSLVQVNYLSERKKKYSEIQLDSLRLQGFSLSGEEQKLFCEVFQPNCTELFSLQKLLNAQVLLKKIIQQAIDKRDDNVAELKLVCKRNWASMMEKCDIWE